MAKKASEKRLKKVRRVLREIASYPPPGHDRRDADGYPVELVYDELAYRRMVDSYRRAIRGVLEL